MMFCPKCGAILLPKGDKGKKVLACGCGYKSKDAPETVKITESGAAKSEREFAAIEETENLPITDAECPKCKHAKAYCWSKQTRAGDEPETRFFRCVKCKATWREYS